MKRRAFTFLELVVALTLILCLVALLLPVLRRGMDAARRTSCQSNLKQHLGALSLYAQDHDGRYPPADATWESLTLTMTKNTGIYACPEEPAASRKLYLAGRPTASGDPGTSYQYDGGHAADSHPNTALLRDYGAWHEGGANVAFLGGSVRWLPGAAADRALPARPRGAPPAPPAATEVPADE
jgi:prepilin-type processing-associated H-X9-DG protein